MKRVEGDWAKHYIAVDLSNMKQVGTGVLCVADELTGYVAVSHRGNVAEVTLGPQRIKIIRKYPR